MEKAVDRHRKIWLIGVWFGAASMIAHVIGVYNNWYNGIPWFDIPLHLSWGAWGALLFYWLIYRFKGYVNVDKNFLVTLVMVLSWVALGGVLWEFGEYLYDLIVYANGFSATPLQFSLDDTLADLVYDLFGGLMVAVIIKRTYQNGENYNND